MKTLLSQFNLLNSLFSSDINTIFNEDDSVHFHFKDPFENDLLEYHNFLFSNEDNNLIVVKYFESKHVDIHSKPYTLGEFSHRLTIFINLIKNEKYLGLEMITFHLRKAFTLDIRLYKGQYKKLMEEDFPVLSKEEISAKIQAKFAAKLNK